MNVPLRIGVRLHQVNEQQVLAALLTDVVEVGVGHDDNALTINKFGRGTIPREVEEVTGPVQLSELLCFQVALQPLQGQRPYAACIDPRVKKGDGVKVFEFRNGLSCISKAPILIICIS